MKQSEPIKLIWKILHNIAASLCLAVVGLYFYEEYVTDFNSYANIVSIVPTKEEFDGNDHIEFHLFANSENVTAINPNLKIQQILMCDDNKNEVGYERISTESVTIAYEDISTQSVIADAVIQTQADLLSYSEVSGKLRQIANKQETPPLEDLKYSGKLPTKSAECFVRFEFSVTTRYFGLEKVSTQQSFPFNYSEYHHDHDDMNYIP